MVTATDDTARSVVLSLAIKHCSFSWGGIDSLPGNENNRGNTEGEHGHNHADLH